MQNVMHRPIHFQFKISNLMLIMLLTCFAAAIFGLNRQCLRLNRELQEEVRINFRWRQQFDQIGSDYIRRLEAIENYREQK